jgi:predicted helicase
MGGPAVDSDDESGGATEKDRRIKSEFQKQMELEFARFQGVIYAKMVQKCGNRLYWEQWAAEHGNPRYILDLLLSVITVSLKTVEIVEKLPKIVQEM